MIYLDKEQLKRLYNVYDFSDNENIVTAYIKRNRLWIEYTDIYGFDATYEPNFDIFTDKEDFDKLKYVLWGEK